MPINFINIDNTRKFSGRKALKEWMKNTIESEGKVCGDITIALCSDSYILEQNIASLGHDYATDILTYPYSEGDVISGDLLISTDTVLSNSELYGVKFEEELHRVMIHGVLHLLDYDDHSDSQRAEMREKENFYLAIFDR